MNRQTFQADEIASNVVGIRGPSKTTLKNSAAIVAAIMSSPKMQEQWEARHKSRADENPAFKRAQEIQAFIEGQPDWKVSLAQKPDHLKLMQDFVAFERGALHSRIFAFAAGRTLKKVKAGLDVVARELASVLPPEFLPRTEDLPKDMQEILRIEEFHTAQKPFQPLKDSANFLWGFLKYMDEEIWEHRHTAAPMAAIMGYVTYLMFSNIGMQSQALTLEETIVHSCGPEDILAGRTGEQCEATVSMAMPKQFERCHVHFVEALGIDCTKITTFGEDAKKILDTGYNANLNRHDETIGNPVQKALSSIEHIGLDSADEPEVARKVYRQTLEATIDDTVEGINKYDVYENLVLHGGILFLVGGLTANALARGKRPTKEGLNSAFNRAGDFALRLKRNSPLTSLAAFAGGFYPANTNYFWQGDVLTGNLNPDVVLYALAAGCAGATIEKAARYIKREDHMEAMVVNVKDQLTALSNARKFNADIPQLTHKKSLTRSTMNKAFAAATTYGLIKLDFMMTNGQLTAQTLGTATPISLFLMSNPITDLIAHKMFALAGGGAGVVLGAGSRGVYVGAKNAAAHLSRKDIIKTEIQPVSFFDASPRKTEEKEDEYERLTQAFFSPLASIYTKNWKQAFPLDKDDIHSRKLFENAQMHLKSRFEDYNLPYEDIGFEERHKIKQMIETAVPAHSKTDIVVPMNV
jgi:hypothetical protein